MPRKKRVIAQSGIYHLFIRGVNRQTIFCDERDFTRMMTLIQNAPIKRDRKGNVISTNRCTIYAYCILGNHVHILLKEGENNISTIMQRIDTAYATYYNLRYKRVGHLFQGVFGSEPIEDDNRFKCCFRYIHRNPVKGSDADSVELYPYSSWNEYVSHKSNLMKVIHPEAMKYIYTWFTQKELIDWVNIANDDQFLDMDSFNTVRTEAEAWEIVSHLSEQPTQEEFRKLDPQIQLFYIFQALEQGVKRSQASRIGSLSIYQINKAIDRKNKGLNNLLGRKKSTKKTEVKPTLLSTIKNPTIHNKVGENDDDNLMTGLNPGISLCQPKVGETRCEQVVIRAAANEYTSKSGYDSNVPTAPEELHDRIRQIPALNRNVYHKLHLIVDYLYRNPQAKCSDVSNHIAVSNEAARKHLIRLSNESIIDIIGKSRSTSYTLSCKLMDEITKTRKLEKDREKKFPRY